MAYGYQRAWPWEAIVIGGYTLTGIQLTALSAICTTYAVSEASLSHIHQSRCPLPHHLLLVLGLPYHLSKIVLLSQWRK